MRHSECHSTGNPNTNRRFRRSGVASRTRVRLALRVLVVFPDHADRWFCHPGAVFEGEVRVVEVDEFRLLRGAERDRVWLDVERAIRCLQAVQSAMLAEVDDSRSYVDDAHRSTRAWVQVTLNCSQPTAVRKVQTARMLAEMPATAEANRNGRLGADQLRLLADLHANPRCRNQLPHSDTLLAEHAAGLTHRDFGQVRERWQA